MLIPSCLLRFSDGNQSHEKPIRKFHIQLQSLNEFFYTRQKVSSNLKSAVEMNQSVSKAFMLLWAPLQSSLTEACRVSSSLHFAFSQLAINHRKWRKVNTGIASLLVPGPLRISSKNRVAQKHWGKNPTRR